MGLLSKLRKTENATLPSITECKDGNKWWASFEFYPLAVGNHKSSFEAMMYVQNDYWSRTKSVVKASNGGPGEEEQLRHEVRISEIADDHASKFHKHYGQDRFTHMRKLNFIRPCLTTLDSVSVFNVMFRLLKQYDKCLTEGEYVLLEPHIGDDFTNFIYSNGVTSSCCPDFLQTFCHFSYFESNGEFVISNLQGTFSDRQINLSSPRIHSRNRTFGDRDSGEKGIYEFFTHHKCNATCQHWPKPTDGPVVFASAPYNSKCEELKQNDFDWSSGSDVTTAQIHRKDLVSPIAPPPYQFVEETKDHEKLLRTTELPAIHKLCVKDS